MRPLEVCPPKQGTVVQRAQIFESDVTSIPMLPCLGDSLLFPPSHHPNSCPKYRSQTKNDLQSHKNTNVVSSNSLYVCLDLKPAMWSLKPLCSGYRIWQSFRNWLGTKLYSHCLPTFASKVPGAAAFNSPTLHCSLPSSSGVCSLGSQLRAGSADLRISRTG